MQTVIKIEASSTETRFLSASIINSLSKVQKKFFQLILTHEASELKSHQKSSQFPLLYQLLTS